MPRRPSWRRRWLTAASWPVGIALTSWDYMWRTTPMRRHEEPGLSGSPAAAELLTYPPGVSREEVQGHEQGCGPLFIAATGRGFATAE